MADYVAIVRGVLPNARPWSTGRFITSGQSPSALLTTWQNAWTTAWNLAVTGMAIQYDAATTITQFEIGTLNATLRKVAKTTATVALVGADAGQPLGATDTIVVEWTSAVTQPYGRGFNRMPPPTENFANDGVISATGGANMKAAFTSIRAAIIADGSTFFVAPRFATESGQPAYAKTVLTGFRVRQQLGTERVREEKVPKTYF